MTSSPDEAPLFGDLAAEPADESVAAEQHAVGDQEDTGDTVPPDGAQ